MKKKVFSLMMTLLLAFMGVAKADVVEIGVGGTTTSSYLPSYSFYNYSLTQQLYTADEIGTAGTINSIAFYNGGSEKTRDYTMYLVNTDKTAFSGSTDWITVTAADQVFTGSVTMVADAWTTITLDTPFAYDGVSNLAVIMDDNTGSWSSGMACRVFDGADCSLRVYSDGTDYDPMAPTSYSGTVMAVKNQLQLDITPGGGGGGGAQIFAVQDGEVVETVYVGARPNGCWMEPFTFQVRNTGAATTITNLDWTPQEYFTLVAPELPVQIARNEDIDVQMTTGNSGNTEWQMVAIYGIGRTAAVWNIVAEPYDPAVPDVWEMACQQATTFPFVEVPATAHNTTLHNDYTLPFPEIPEGYDAVYKLVFAEDRMMNAEVTYGANGKVALYTEDFYGEGGPMADNNYTGIQMGAGAAAAGPFEVQIGEGTSTLGYIPMYAFYNYSISEQLFLAPELVEAGVTTAPFTSLSWYATSIVSATQNNISIWMANVTDEAMTTTSHLTSGMTLVYTGSLTPAIGWNEFLFNGASFAWDGSSNLLICVQRNNGTYQSGMNWQTHNAGFNASDYRYNDGSAYDMMTTQYDTYTSTSRANVIMKGGNRDRETLTYVEGYGPVIEDAAVERGTYYLVASSTDPNFEVTINAEAMPCPAVEDFAFQPQPADNEDEVEPSSVTLRWMVPQYATGWRIIFGTTYYPEPNHPQTVMYPADGSFTREMANSFTVRNLWNNTNYFWRVEFNNDGCPDGVSGPVWGFTTHLNVPQNLTAVDETVFDDETITLNWNAVVDRTYRMYNVYRDGELIGHTTVNNIGNTTYTDGPLSYNMGGYVYYVTAVYDEGESAPSNTVNVKVSGYGDVNGHVYEQDGTTGIAGATVTMVGQDEFGVNHTYNFTTNTQGYYTGHIYAGEYNGQAAKDGYQTIYEPVQGNPIAIVYSQTTSPVDYVLDENFDPVCAVIAEYYPDSLDPNSPYVKVYWGCGLPGSDIIEDFETGDFSMFDWQVDPTYPWSITTNNPYEGTYCMKSGGAGVANVVSNMTVTVEIPADGLMSFFGKISCESNWDYGYFYIDGVQRGQYTGAGNWTERQFDITAGEHTFQWRYTKDSSVNSNDDCFYVDYINFYKQPEPPVPGMTYDFENSTMQGWTSLDADGDGYGWYVASDIMSTGYGHNGSNDCVLSQSWYGGTVLYPDNYLVSPQVALGGVVTFYACAQDNLYAAEHFGVAVSTTSNTNPSAFTMLNEWTMTAKKVGDSKSMDNAVADVSLKSYSRDGNTREQGNWYQYTVDLSAYAGQTGYVAIRHFNCSDMFYLDVDDITISEPGKSAPENTRAFSHYRVYRTNCYNDGPYTLLDEDHPDGNTVVLACELTDTIYIDTYWPDVAPGVYKWGVGVVYVGNRGELYESPITWATPVAIRDTNAEATDQRPVRTECERAPWDLLASFVGTSAGQQAVATDGNYIYTASWQTAPTGGYTFYQYDMSGNFIEGFNIAGATGIRDLTTDGQYFYGSSGSASIFKLDLANRTLVGTINCTGATSRHCTYDPVRNGLWVGNWSTLALYDMTGSLVFTAPTPTSAYGSAYFMDDSGEEHLYLFCQPSSDAKVFDYNITTNTLGTTAIFDFAATPGFDEGIAGGAFIADYNGTTAFFGNVQQNPNLIGIYELRESTNPNPGPTPGGDSSLQEPRESEIVWSNCLDKDMYLDANEVTVNVLLNSADSPEGIQVTFTNYNEVEQDLYPVAPIILDETGFYAFDSFRKGEYKVNVTFDGYEPIEDSVSIWEPTDLRYVMIEIIYTVSDLYVSSTGWAMWGAEGTPGTGGGGGGQGGGTTFTEDFEGGIPNDWTLIDADGDGNNWYDLVGNNPNNIPGHNGSEGFATSASYNGSVLYPDNYLVTPQVTLGGSFSFYACAQDASWAAEHFGVAVSTSGNTNANDFTTIQEWTLTAKSLGAQTDETRSGNRDQGAWYQYTVDLSSYAGQTGYVAIRHFGCHDMFRINVDDITMGGAKSGDRHLEYFKVLCTSIDGEPIFNADTEHPFCQVATDELIPGDHYICKVAAMYSTGISQWVECEWQYIPCDNYAGTLNGVTIEGNNITWDYPNGTGPTPPPGQGDTFTESWDNGLNGWTNIDADGDGHMWYHSTEAGNHSTQAVTSHSGAGHVMGESYCNATWLALTPDDYLVSPQQYAITTGSTLTFWGCAQDVSYAAEHFGVAISTGSNTNAGDFTTIQEWTLTAKSAGNAILGRGGRGSREGTWHQYTCDLSNYAGQNVWIAIRHFNCTDMFIMDLDDAELSIAGKGNRAEWTFANGFVTDPGAMANGGDASWIKGTQSTYGPGCQQANGNRVGDSFTVSDAPVYIDEITVYGYQTGSSTTSTFNGLYAQIYDGNPMSGGQVVWGDANVNIMTATAFTNCYRGSDGDATGTTRPIMSITASGLNIELAPGTYYLVYQLNGTGSSGPWAQPHAEPTVGNTGNGVQYVSTGWQTLSDSGNGQPYGVAMMLHGTQGGVLPPTPSGDILGAMIFADGEWEAFVEYPTNTYTYEGNAEEVCVRMVYNGTNTLPEGNIYYSMSCPECEPYASSTCEPGAPIHAEQVNNQQIKIWWGEQIIPVEEWLYYDDGTYATSVGAGGTLYWGIMFPANSLAPYAGTSLTKVAVHTSYACSATLNVYVGGAQPGGSPAATQTFTMAGDQEFMEITLNNPVAVDGTQNLWITFYQSGETYPADACNDTGDANNRWVSVDGASWMDLATAGLPGYGWMIRGFVTNMAKGGEMVSLPEFKGNVGGELSHTEVVSKPANLSFMNRANLVKYNVYRSTSAAGEYTMIGSVNEDGSTYYEYIDAPAEAGMYYYQVRAEYDNDCESDPAMAADGSGNNYVSGSVTIGDGLGENNGMAIYPNPTKGNVTIEANGMRHITVVSMLGQVVFDADVENDTYILNMSQYTAGMYTVRVVTENGVNVNRITVVR